MGADSAAIAGRSLQVRADTKVFRTGALLIGFCGSYRIGQLLRYAFEAPPLPTAAAGYVLHRYLVLDVMNVVRAVLQAHDCPPPDEATSGEFGWLLIGVQGVLFRVEPDFQVSALEDDFAAVGAGAALAQGALHATTRAKLDPHARIRGALEAAERYSPAVRGPFVICSMPPL